jgi:hypothetical protein
MKATKRPPNPQQNTGYGATADNANRRGTVDGKPA